MNRLFKNNIPGVVLVLCLKGNGQSGLKVSFVNKGLGTGLTLSLSPHVHYPTIQMSVGYFGLLGSMFIILWEENLGKL